MDRFLASRRADPRFANERRVTMGSGTASTTAASTGAWYASAPRRSGIVKRSSHRFAVKKDKDGKKKLTDGETSDGTDSGVCWSDYERVPGTKEGEKGSCRPKKKKKASGEGGKEYKYTD